MKVYATYRERLAGVFMLFAVLGVAAFVVGAAIENRWFEPRISYHTVVVRGDGLRTGSPVLLSGIEVGEVGDLEIMDDNRIDVELVVQERHAARVRIGTVAEVRRLLGIGEKRIYLVSPDTITPELPADAILPAKEHVDILDAISNVDLGKYVATLDRAVAAMEVVLSKMEEGDRITRMMQAFDQMGPTMQRMNELLAELEGPLAELFNDPAVVGTFRGADKLFNDPNTRKSMLAMSKTFEPERMDRLLKRMDSVITRFDDMLDKQGHFYGAMEGADKLLNDKRMDRMLTSMDKMAKTKKMEKLLDDMSVVAEQMAKMGPKIPLMTQEAIATMRELVIVLKALQKTWLLDDEAKQVLKDFRKKAKEND